MVARLPGCRRTTPGAQGAAADSRARWRSRRWPASGCSVGAAHNPRTRCALGSSPRRVRTRCCVHRRLGLLGAVRKLSRCGKLLTLALVAGLNGPYVFGTIAINGRIVTDRAHHINVSPQKRRVGMVFQDGRPVPHRSVLDNVALAVRQVDGRRARRAIAQTWLERVGADAFGDRRPASLSGGQRSPARRARRGLAGDPSLRPLAASCSPQVHLEVRRELRGLIRSVIGATGVPALLVTHDAEEAEELGDVIIGYRNGQAVSRPARSRDPEATSRSRWTPALGGPRGPYPGAATGSLTSYGSALGLEPALRLPSRRRRGNRCRGRPRRRSRLHPRRSARFPGRGAIEILFSMPMALPPTVVGWYLLVELGGPGPIRNAEVRLLAYRRTFTFRGSSSRRSSKRFPTVCASGAQPLRNLIHRTRRQR